MPIYNGTLKKLCLIKYELDINVLVSLNCLFSFVGSLLKLLTHSLFIRNNGENHRNKHFSSQKNDAIFRIFDQIKVSRLPLQVRHCNLCMEGHLKFSIQSLKYRFICILNTMLDNNNNISEMMQNKIHQLGHQISH